MQRDPRPVVPIEQSLDARRAGRRGEADGQQHSPSPPAGRVGRPKVIPLPRALPGGGPIESSPGAGTPINLQTPIDTLRSMKADLEAYYWDRRAEDEVARTERYQIRLWLRLIGDRTSALESIVLEKQSPHVFVDRLGAADADAVAYAAAMVLDSIPEDEPFAAVAERVARLLAASDRIALCAAAGNARR